MSRYESYKQPNIDWVGEIPTNWETVQPKYKLNRVTRPVDDDNEVITCFRDGVVTLRKNRREGGFTNSIKEHGYQQIHPGDLVVHEMDSFAGAIGISDSKGKSTPVYTVVEPDNRTDLKYIAYLLREMSQTGKIESLARSIRERTTDFRWNMWSVIHFPFPPVEEQKVISRYLDKKTDQIDRLIKQIQKKIELLKEQRTSLINQCVTKGLDPDVEMKDSGVEWIDEIPKHWKIVPLFSVATENKLKNKEKNENVLSLSYGKIIRRDLSKNFGLIPESFDGYQVVDRGYIIIRSTDLQNDKKSLRVGLVEEYGVITSAYIGLSLSHQIYPDYLFYYLNMCDLKKVFYSLGGGLRQSLRFEEFRRFPVVLPTVKEQKVISRYLDKKTDQIDRLIKQIQKKIDLLSEYRQSLISSVVTGKVRITEDML